MTARKNAATTPDTGAIDALCAELAALPTLAAAGRVLGYNDAQNKGFRGNVRAIGTYRGGSRGADASVVDASTFMRLYTERPTVKARMDALIESRS